MDQDRHHTYVRKTSEIVLPRNEFKIKDNTFSHMNEWRERKTVEANMFILGFCGEIYVGLRIDGSHIHRELHYGDCDELIKILEIHDYAACRWKTRYEGLGKYSVKYFREVFESGNMNKLKGQFLKYGAPVFIAVNFFPDNAASAGAYCPNSSKRQKIILNPCLKDYEFYRIKDSYTAYQDIGMYVGNQLVDDGDNAWPIDDELKAQSKGFNKHSFRKDKSE
jgi:hypothetical protein